MLSAAPTLSFCDDAEGPLSEGGSLKFPGTYLWGGVPYYKKVNIGGWPPLELVYDLPASIHTP